MNNGNNELVNLVIEMLGKMKGVKLTLEQAQSVLCSMNIMQAFMKSEGNEHGAQFFQEVIDNLLKDHPELGQLSNEASTEIACVLKDAVKDALKVESKVNN